MFLKLNFSHLELGSRHENRMELTQEALAFPLILPMKGKFWGEDEDSDSQEENVALIPGCKNKKKMKKL